MAARPHPEDQAPAAPSQWPPGAGAGAECDRALLRGDGGGPDLPSAPMEADTEITGPIAASCSCPPARQTTRTSPGGASVHAGPQGSDLPGCHRSEHAGGAGLAAGLASQARSVLSEPYRPYHTHDEKQPLTPGEVVELDVEIWPTSIVVPKAIASVCRFAARIMSGRRLRRQALQLQETS